MTEWSGKHQSTLPEEVVARFRVASLERIERLEDAWTQLTSDPTNAETIATIDREVHTLKGESRMVGFTDVDMVAHKLEDVLEVARERQFQINDDLDLVVTMALRFMTMLIQKKAGQTLGGIDLPGFVRQIDTVVRDTRHQHPLRGRIATSPLARLENKELIAGNVRERLAGVALDLFLELTSGRESRRVRRAWNQLRDSLAPADPLPIAPVLAKHEAGGTEIARDIGKQIDFAFELDPAARAPASVVAALDTAALHLVRNAIDHGIGTPLERMEGGKPPVGQIRVRCTVDQDRVVLEVTDDGKGIDFGRVRARGIELGLIADSANPSDADLSKLLFHPGLTTTRVPTALSGRGIGLDVVHSHVSAVGGTATVTSSPSAGTVWTIEMPSPRRRFRVRKLAVRGTNVPFAIPVDWDLESSADASDAVDLVDELELGTPSINPLTYILRRGDSAVRIGAASEPVEAEARWLVSTSASTLVGVVSIDNVECLVLKPDVLVTTTGRVAIVDDSEIVREIVGFSLKPYGIEVFPFSDPAPLVGTLAVRPVDLVLLDLSFKGLDVSVLIQRIKAALPGCQVYLHSDRNAIELARLANSTNADGHLAKALGREQFVARVLKILRARRR